MSLTSLDLFCGAGGFTAGLSAAGFNVIGAVDSWSVAVANYRKNFTHPVVEADVSTLDAKRLVRLFGDEVRSLDLLVGGPPCQGFSVQRIGQNEDKRNSLILEFARIVHELQPRAFVMENVLGLLGIRGRQIYGQLQHDLKSDGFEVRTARINAAEFGVPQNRRRVFVYGWRSPISALCFPLGDRRAGNFRTVWDAIGDLPSVDTRAGLESPHDPLHRRIRLSDKNLERLKLIPPGKGFESLPPELRVRCHQNGASKIGHRNVYGRLAPDAPAGTITARFDSFTRGKFAHPFEHRNISLREGARLQTFPDTFRFHGTQEQVAALIGNAVPPLLATAVATSFRDQLLGLTIAREDGADRQRALSLSF
jgi:DNA (cytosine-5)-methyltransferase 1